VSKDNTIKIDELRRQLKEVSF